MKTSKKIVIAVISIILVLIISFVFLLIANGGDIFALFINKSLLPPGYNKTDAFLTDNFDDLLYVSKELSEKDYTHIDIRNTSLYGEEKINMEVKRDNSNYDTIPIPEELLDSVKTLFEKGIHHIEYTNGNLDFVIWSGMYETRGIEYGTEPSGEQLIEVRQLSEENWYYYVHNYEKAKELHPEKFE